MELSTAMVMCDLCKTWYHLDCINVQQAYAKAATFYHCKACILGNFGPFLRYVTQCRRQIKVGCRQEMQNLLSAWNKKSITYQRTIEGLNHPEETFICLGEGVRNTVN